MGGNARPAVRLLLWAGEYRATDASPLSLLALMQPSADIRIAPCRSCGTDLGRLVVDLGLLPLVNNYPRSASDAVAAPRYPLAVRVCEACWLLQLEQAVPPTEMFSDYAYLSSYSDTWLEHAEQFAEHAIRTWHLDSASSVVEVASNDGYLLRHFASRGIPVLGIDPAENVVAAAAKVGVPTEVAFFGIDLATRLIARGVTADLLIANNVLAHVPDVNDFVAALALVLAPGGVLSIEFPELSRLLEQAQFDQIYHEHVFYFSLLSCESLLARHGLRVIEVTPLRTHGGSLRIVACHDSADYEESRSVKEQRTREAQIGLASFAAYDSFAAAAAARVSSLHSFVNESAALGRRIVAYGAAAKGTVLLNYCNLSTREVSFVVDRNPRKQGRFLPGVGIPILQPSAIPDDKPDYVLALAWNLLDEIERSIPDLRDWGGHLVTTVPTVAILP